LREYPNGRGGRSSEDSTFVAHEKRFRATQESLLLISATQTQVRILATPQNLSCVSFKNPTIDMFFNCLL
jgi:hypothetical protein